MYTCWTLPLTLISYLAQLIFTGLLLRLTSLSLKKKNREKKSWIFSIVKYKREGEAASRWTGRIQRTYNSLSLLLLVGPCSFELLKSLWSLVSSNQSAVPVSSDRSALPAFASSFLPEERETREKERKPGKKNKQTNQTKGGYWNASIASHRRKHRIYHTSN